MNQGLNYRQSSSPQRWLLLVALSCGLHLLALLALGVRWQWLSAPGESWAEPTPVELVDLADLPPQVGEDARGETAADTAVEVTSGAESGAESSATSERPPMPSTLPSAPPDFSGSSSPGPSLESRAPTPQETPPTPRERSSPRREPVLDSGGNGHGSAPSPGAAPSSDPAPAPARPDSPPPTAPAPGDGAGTDPPTESGSETTPLPETLNARWGGTRVSPTGRDIPDQLPQIQAGVTSVISWPLAATNCDLSARDRIPHRAQLALRIVVEADGTLLGVRTEESSGDAGIDRLVECLVMARPPRLAPAISGGQPIISDAALLDVELSLP